MKILNKRLGAFLTASALALGLIVAPAESVPFSLGHTVSAREQSAAEYASPGGTSALPDSKELEKLWIEQLFYGEGVSFYKDYGRNHLKGAALELYELLRAKIEAISAGTDDITSFPINMNETFGSKTELDAGIRMAMDALMADLPADFYWYDKTAGYVYFSNQEGAKVTKIIFSISEDYVNPSGGSETVDYGDGTSDIYKVNVDSSKMTAARTAVQNAQAIAAKYADKSDYEKIIGYKNEICELVEYNDFAADDSNNTPYGDPWQLVWVFDKNNSTDVVCEGYSKAFQYLCDLGGIECYTVSGDVNGGAHMWNIAVLDGKSYHVDVTWCDGGFDFCLKGAATSSEAGFTMSQGNTSYVYDADTCSLYSSAGILTVSTEDYDPGVSGEISIEVSPKTKSIAVGDTFTLTVDVTATEGLEGIDGYLYFDCNETVISVEDNGNGAVTVCGLTEGETDLVVGWEPDENAGITLENPIVDTCTVTVTAAECEHEWGTKWEKDDDYHWHVCTKCGAAGTKTKHKMGPNDVGKEPTCTEDGKGTGYKCLDNCGYMEEGSVKPALGHDYKDVPGSGKEPTCVEEGKEPDQKCSRCDDLIEGETISATGKHTPGEPVQENIVNATCTTAGSYDEVEYCTECGAEISRTPKTGEKLPHDMKEVPGSAKAPTCAEAGKEADQKCENCGYTETGKAIPKTDEHTAGAPVRRNEVPATCTKEGSYDEVIECTVCHKELSSEAKTIEKLPHTPGTPAEENRTEPTCTANGSYDLVTKCTVCGEASETVHNVIPAKGHTFTSYLVQGETSHYRECTECHIKVGEEPHSENSGTVTLTPTDTADGERTYMCKICDMILRTETIPALGEDHVHDYAIYAIINYNKDYHWNECICGAADAMVPHTASTKEETVLEATCNVDGLKYVITYCTDCGAEISRASEAIPKTGVHTPGTEYGKDSEGHWKTCLDCGEALTKESHIAGPAATEETPQTCTVCGYEIAPVLAHTHKYSTEWSKDENFHWHAATCQHTDEVKDKSTHNWDEGIVTTEPTETSKGVKTYTCGTCGATRTELVSELAHTHKPGTQWRFNASGHWHECGGCDEKLDFAAHNVVSEVTKAPLPTVSGTRRYYCSICKYVVREEAIPATGVISDPSYPSGNTNVFPPFVSSSDEPKLENGSGGSGWDSIVKDIEAAASGSAVRVDMNGTYKLPREILKEIAGKNVDLVLEMNDKITWTINGETVEKIKDINMRARLNTKNIPESAVEAAANGNDAIQLSLSHSGSFGFDAVMTVTLGARYDGMFANLMYYDPKAEALEFIDCGQISGGRADLDFSHASEYAIIISAEPMGEYEDVSSASGIYVNDGHDLRESAVYLTGTTLLAIAAAVAVYRKRVKK